MHKTVNFLLRTAVCVLALIMTLLGLKDPKTGEAVLEC